MTRLIQGIIHLHSTYSHDGTMSLKEIAALAREKGCRFMAVTEHAESMDADKVSKLVAECTALSDGELVVIPGLEYICEGMHILALGVGALLDDSDLKSLIGMIHSRGGLALLAHVVYYDSIPYGKLEDLDGIEIWNPRYGSRFSPSVKSLGILKKFRKRNRDILALCGLDMHKRSDYCRIRTRVNVDGPSSEDVIKALRAGRFQSAGEIVFFDSRKGPGTGARLTIYALGAFYWSVKKAIYLFKAAGFRPPEKISRRARSIIR
jgi:histidinol phosphatase-like PHP family hydrolase